MRIFVSRLTALFRRGRLDRSLDDDIRAHLDLLAADFVRQGMQPEEARLAARRAFGGVEQMKETHRDRRGLPWVDDARRDLQYAARTLARTPGFTAVAVLTLALGIGATAGVFSLLDALFLKSLAIPEPQQLVRLVDGQRDIFTYPELESIRSGTKTLGHVILAPSAPSLASLNAGGNRDRIEADGEAHFAAVHTVSREYFDVLGVRAWHGRTFDALDSTASDPVAVISASYWRRHYGESPSALGARFRHGNRELTVVGIAPPGFGGTIVDSPADIWEALDQLTIDPADPTWTRSWIPLMARLQPDSTEAAAAAELTALLGRPVGVERAATGYSVLRTQFRTPVLMLAILTGLVLLIACANLANLMFARAATRTRELAVRSAIGASRGRLTRQALAEALLIAGIGGMAALAVAHWTSEALLAFLPAGAEGARDALSLAFDPRLLALTAIASLASGVLFGLGPALRGSQNASTVTGIAAGLRTRAVERSTRNALVVSQVAICVVLLTVSALCARTLWNLESLDAGFVREQVLAADVQPPPGRSREQNLQLLEDLRRAVAALPGAQAAAFSQMGALSGFGIEASIPAQAPILEQPISAYEQRVSSDFLDAIGTPLLEGRSFDSRDRADSPPVAIVTESFVRRVFPARRAIGQHFRIGDPERGAMLEIVGVAKDSIWASLRDAPSPMFYRPIVQVPSIARPRFAIRASGDLDALAAGFVRTARALDPRILVDNVVPMTAVVDRSLARERMAAHLSALVALLAALIACIGVYGVLSHDVAQRTHEIGIRSALGAGRRELIGLVLRQGLVPTTIGIAIGLAVAAATTGYAEALLYGITPLDLPTFAGVAVAFALVAAFACYVPARRATMVDPVIALRAE